VVLDGTSIEHVVGVDADVENQRRRLLPVHRSLSAQNWHCGQTSPS
jgi:hypothetical protein